MICELDPDADTEMSSKKSQPEPESDGEPSSRISCHRVSSWNLWTGRIFSGIWSFEIASMLLSLALFVAMTTTLAHSNGKIHPNLPFGISLNTFLSVCMTTVVASLMVPISSGLGQMKWIQARVLPIHLTSMTMIGEASRGPWGSLCLIFTLKGGILGLVGAFAALMSLPAAPFAQQAIYITSEYIESATEAVVALCDGSVGEFPDPNSLTGSLYEISLPLRAAVSTGIFGNYDLTSYSSQFLRCPTGTCSWDLMTTLGVCSTCQTIDLSHRDYRGLRQNYTLPYIPGGASIPDEFTSFSMTSSGPGDTEDFNIAYFTAISNSTKMGIQCWLDFCLLNIQTEVKNGNFTENIHSQAYAGHSALLEAGISLNTEFSTTLHDYFVNMFNGTYTGKEGQFTSDVVMSLQENYGEDIPAKMVTLAAALTRKFRESCGSKSMVDGTAYTALTVVYIHWRWLVVPLVMELFGISFFITILCISRTSNAQVWKNTILASLFHGFEFSTTENENLSSLRRMEEFSKGLIVRLEDAPKDNERARLAKFEEK